MSAVSPVAEAETTFSVEALVTLGPESAALYGLPVGTVIDCGIVAASDPDLVGGADELAPLLMGEAV